MALGIDPRLHSRDVTQREDGAAGGEGRRDKARGLGERERGGERAGGGRVGRVGCSAGTRADPGDDVRFGGFSMVVPLLLVLPASRHLVRKGCVEEPVAARLAIGSPIVAAASPSSFPEDWSG